MTLLKKIICGGQKQPPNQTTDLCVGGSSPGLRVKLGGEDWLGLVHDALKETQGPQWLHADGFMVLDQDYSLSTTGFHCNASVNLTTVIWGFFLSDHMAWW